jgi:hypothetical protein
LATLEQYVTPRRRVIIGALIDGWLGGYLAGFALDGTAYVEEVHLSTEAYPITSASVLPSNLCKCASAPKGYAESSKVSIQGKINPCAPLKSGSVFG